jgi:hypothetical protein
VGGQLNELRPGVKRIGDRLANFMDDGYRLHGNSFMDNGTLWQGMVYPQTSASPVEYEQSADNDTPTTDVTTSDSIKYTRELIDTHNTINLLHLSDSDDKIHRLCEACMDAGALTNHVLFLLNILGSKQ